jgi:hypothetical protein
MTNSLTQAEVQEAHRLWREERDGCEASLREEGRPVSEQNWIDYCKYCKEEFGASPFGY